MDVPAAANVLGTLGAVCWSTQLIPQIVLNYIRHHATGLQPSMMMLWAWAGVPLGVYNIVSNFNVALRIQPQILTVLSLVTWAQCYYYQRVRLLPLTLCADHGSHLCCQGLDGRAFFRRAYPGCSPHGRDPGFPHRRPPNPQGAAY